MKDLTPAHDASSTDQNGKYPKARRKYRTLAVLHFGLFGAGGAGAALQDGAGVIAAIAGGVLVGGLFAVVLWHLGEEHYHGRVPGKTEK